MKVGSIVLLKQAGKLIRAIVIDIDTELGLVLSILKSEDEGCSRNRRDKFGDCSNCTSNDCMGCKYYG